MPLVIVVHPRRCPVITRGRPPRNKGEQYPADPPTLEAIVAVMRSISENAKGHRLRALVVRSRRHAGVAFMPRAVHSVGMAKKTADAAARNLLLSSPDERVQHQLAVTALVARNALLEALESARSEQGLTKADLAAMAGLDASSVRRLLTSKTANPTTENAFRLMAAMGIQLEATLPTGERIKLVDAGAVRGSKAKQAVPA